jgi:aryl-alcohol dehydrogenase-like predicted oxidoreductase
MMETARLGPEGPRVSRLGLGLAALGRPGYINLGHGADLEGRSDPASMRDLTHRVIDLARSHGVNYFDTARSYGSGEEFLASWLRGRAAPDDGLVIASKWGYTYTAGWRVDAEAHEVKDHSAATLRRQIAESRAILGDHLDLYQIHSATLESGVLRDREVLDELARLRDRGLRIGLSVSGPGQADTIRQALRVRRGGERLFTTVQATWNLLEPSAAGALEEAFAEGVAVILKEVLANGRLTGRGDEAEIGPASRIAASLRVGIDAMAIAAALARPWATVVLSGAATEAQLVSNLAAIGVGWTDDLEAGLGELRMRPSDYWSSRSRLPWN